MDKYGINILGNRSRLIRVILDFQFWSILKNPKFKKVLKSNKN